MNNPLDFFLNIIKSGGNPQQMMIQYLESQKDANPMLLDMARRGDAQAMEQFARNVCQQRGVDFDTEFRAFRQKTGL